MRGHRRVAAAIVLGLGAASCAVAVAGAPAGTRDGLVIGQQCDLTGPAAAIGRVLCQGMHDYVALVNAGGGVEGRTITVVETDHASRVSAALEGYERMKREGAVLVGLFGAPGVYALAPRLGEDRIPGTAPGFAMPASRDGKRFPFMFPLAASDWSQAAAAVKLVKDELGGLEGKRIAFLHVDDPAGRAAIPLLQDLQTVEGFDLETFAVRPPAIEMDPAVRLRAVRYRPDYVITHLFGEAASVALRQLRAAGYPLRHVVALAWGGTEPQIEAAGGWAAAEGYRTIQLAAVGSDFPVLREIRAMYEKEGKAPPPAMASTVLYNRGVALGALHVEALRHALRARGDGALTGDDVKGGLEQISGVTLDGLAPPLRITPEDHEGGGFVRIYEVKGGQLVRRTDWYRAYVDVVRKRVKTAPRTSSIEAGLAPGGHP